MFNIFLNSESLTKWFSLMTKFNQIALSEQCLENRTFNPFGPIYRKPIDYTKDLEMQ